MKFSTPISTFYDFTILDVACSLVIKIIFFIAEGIFSDVHLCDVSLGSHSPDKQSFFIAIKFKACYR